MLQPRQDPQRDVLPQLGTCRSPEGLLQGDHSEEPACSLSRYAVSPPGWIAFLVSTRHGLPLARARLVAELAGLSQEGRHG